MDSNLEAIVKTLIYSDIFDYPLKKEEIWKYLIGSDKFSRQIIYSFLENANKFFGKKSKYYFLKGREEIIDKRMEREKQSVKKINVARKIINKLAYFPTVDFIGISGALSMKNSGKEDDIDLFVICKKNSVWSTRFMLVLFLKLFGIYRGRADKKVSNKICLNFLIDKSQVKFLKQKQDLYTAHEILQMLPVFSRDKTYEKFIDSNKWIKNFLPNVSPKKSEIIVYKTFLNYFFSALISNRVTEFLIKRVQFWYMKKNITKETITDNTLAFHPFDYKTFVLNKYQRNLKKLI